MLLLLLFVVFAATCIKEESNIPPSASFVIRPDVGDTETVIMFIASQCIDKEDDRSVLQIHWDWENDGTWDTDYSINKDVTYKFSLAGTYTVKLEVKDLGGLIDTETKTITINNTGNIADGIFTDLRDGNIYEYVTIGTQTWMAENLAYLPEVSDPEHGSNDYPYYYAFNYEGTNVFEANAIDNYGILYNWHAAKISCPEGWHLPSDEEWKIMERYLGMSNSDADDIRYRSSGGVGRKLKSIYGWQFDGNGDNSSGFNAYPGGMRYKGNFYILGTDAYFWSSSIYEGTFAWLRSLNCRYESRGVQRNNGHRQLGFSVRCLQN